MAGKVHLHGFVSVIFVIAAMTIGFVAIFRDSAVLATFFAMIVAFVYCVIAVVFCSKCCCRDTCNHLFVGILSKVLSKSKTTPYTNWDMLFGAILPIGIAIILPQFWLIKFPTLLLSFWILLLIGATEIILFVCKGCRNTKCSMCR